MEHLIRFSKTCTFVNTKIVDGEEVKYLFELAMYATKKDYYASAVHKGEVVRDFVSIDAYGLQIMEICDRNGDIIKSEPVDLGVKSAHPRHINSLIHALCRAPVTDIKAVRTRYEDEAASQEWCKGWPDALAHVASVQLGRNLSTTELSPFTTRVRDKRDRMLRKLNPLKHLPSPESKDRGFDA